MPQRVTLKYELQESDELPRLLHRLDKDTSGLLLLARTRAAAAKYSRFFADKNTPAAEKCYLALVSGVPKLDAGRIRGGLKKEFKDGVEKVVNLATHESALPPSLILFFITNYFLCLEGSKLGITEYEVLDEADKVIVCSSSLFFDP